MATPDGSSLVGREDELANLEELLLQGTPRLVLAGPPGVGKTAIARTIASRPERDAYWVDLSTARSAHDAWSLALGAFGLTRGSAPDGEMFAGILDAHAPCLVILDGADRCGEISVALEPLLGAAGPERSVLVTCRSLVPDVDAVTLEIPPLRVPDHPGDDGASAMQLWWSRMRKARGYTAADQHERENVAHILQLASGLPLAIELAAARAARVGTRELARALDSRLDVLRSMPGAPASSLRAAIAEVADNLPEDVQRALAWLSIFRGSFDLPAAAAVLGTSQDDALRAIDGIRQSCLLVRDRTDTARLPYSLLAPARDLARERLAAGGDLQEAGARHARHYGALARRFVRDRSDAAARAGLSDHGNARAVVERALERSGSIEEALWVAIALERSSWSATWWLAESLTELLARAQEVDGMLRATAEVALATLEVQSGAAARGLVRCDAAEPALRRNVCELARCLRTRALLLAQLGRVPAAEFAIESAIEHARLGGDGFLEGLCFHVGARLALRRGDHDQALRRYEDALDRHRRSREPRWEGAALAELAVAHADRGELLAAEACTQHGMELETGDPMVAVVLRGSHGVVIHARGDAAEALRHYEAAIEMASRCGDRRYAGLCAGYRGIALLDLGRVGVAQRALADASAVMRAVGDAAHQRLFDAYALIASVRQGVRVDDAVERLRAPDDADAWLRRSLAILSASLGGPEVDAARDGVDARIARRIANAQPDQPVVGERARLVISRDGFATPHRGHVDTRRRRPLHRIVEALAAAHVATPGRPLGPDELIAAGWPNERILPHAALNRLHVTLSRLRDLGLREMILLDENGWMLAPDVIVDVDPP